MKDNKYIHKIIDNVFKPKSQKRKRQNKINKLGTKEAVTTQDIKTCINELNQIKKEMEQDKINMDINYTKILNNSNRENVLREELLKLEDEKKRLIGYLTLFM